jgi:serine/threonine protein kinase
MPSTTSTTAQYGKLMGLKDFDVGRPLGRGNYGRVYLARHRKSGFICAIKMLSKKRLMKSKAEYLLKREIDIQSTLR